MMLGPNRRRGLGGSWFGTRLARCRCFVFSALTVSLGAVLSVAVPAYAGYVIDDGHVETAVSKGRVLRRGHGATMVDLRTGRLWITGLEKPVYWEGTVDEYCRLERAEWLSESAQLREEIAKESPEERTGMAPWMKDDIAKLEERLRRMGALSGEVAKPLRVIIEQTRETATIAGQLTRKYRVLANGSLYQELWLTTSPALARELALEGASETWGRFRGCWNWGFGDVEETPEYRQLFRLGWPLKIVSYKFKDPFVEIETIRVELRNVPEHEFNPPATLKKVPLTELLRERL